VKVFLKLGERLCAAKELDGAGRLGVFAGLERREFVALAARGVWI
jgi:hypothetical protein